MKERLIVQTLIKEFVEKEKTPSIALLVGIRKIGKTTVLKQLNARYPNSFYIELDDGEEDISYKINKAIDSNTSLILIDEYTNLSNYDRFAQELYNQVSDNNVKVIITGSSPYHLYKLAIGKLGGGRSRIFKLPPLTFTEYLFFTNKICSYDCYDEIKNQWFIDYLKSKDLKPNISLTLDENYFNDWSRNNTEVNYNTGIAKNQNDTTKDDLVSVFNLVAYNLINNSSYNSILNPKIGGQEHIHLHHPKLGYKLSQIDLTNLLIGDSVQIVSNLESEEIARILLFLIDSGLAIVSISSNDITLPEVREVLSKFVKKKEVIDLFKNITIILSSTIYYIGIGEEIFKRFGVTLDVLDKGYLTGMLLECYITGAIYNGLSDIDLTIKKLICDGDDEKEVDIFIPTKMLMIESTISNKKNSEIHLDQYYKDKACIRICSSDNKEVKTEWYTIPYGKLMYLLDTGKVYDLKVSTIHDL